MVWVRLYCVSVLTLAFPWSLIVGVASNFHFILSVRGSLLQRQLGSMWSTLSNTGGTFVIILEKCYKKHYFPGPVLTKSFFFNLSWKTTCPERPHNLVVFTVYLLVMEHGNKAFLQRCLYTYIRYMHKFKRNGKCYSTSFHGGYAGRYCTGRSSHDYRIVNEATLQNMGIYKCT